MQREQVTEQLRLWAIRAQHEAQEADTREDVLSWQGQAQVLGSVAAFLAGQGAQADDAAIWKQLIADRSRAIANWEGQQSGPEAMYYSGVVAGYDLVLTTLSDVMGRSWTYNVRSTNWVNR